MLLLSGVTPISVAQDLHDIKKRIGLLKKTEAFRMDTTNLSKIPRPKIEDCMAALDASNYHVSDLNQDGKNDIIYSGDCDPYDRTFIFINSGNSYSKIFEETGKIVLIEKGSYVTKVHVLVSPCCCYEEYILREVIIDKNSKSTISSISISNLTKINLGNEVKEISVSGVLRKTPKIDDEKRKHQCGYPLNGNRIAEIKPIKKVIQLNESNRWLLVLYEGDYNQSFVGWIKDADKK
jgi:hypothetical protein